MPRWLSAMVKARKKVEEFAIERAAGAVKAVKKAGRKKRR